MAFSRVLLPCSLLLCSCFLLSSTSRVPGLGVKTLNSGWSGGFQDLLTSSIPHVRPQAMELWRLWLSAMETLDAARVATLYASNAILLPLPGRLDVPRKSRASIEAYYAVVLAQMQPVAILDEAEARYAGDGRVVSLTGTHLLIMRATGRMMRVRFTMEWLYSDSDKEDGGWQILTHHMSPSSDLLL